MMIDDVRNLLQTGHRKENDTPEETLNRLWQKHPSAREDKYGKDFIESVPKNLTDENLSVSLEDRSTEALGRLICNARTKKPRVDKDTPVVVVKYRGQSCLIDGGRRITKWCTEYDPHSRKAYVLTISA